LIRMENQLVVRLKPTGKRFLLTCKQESPGSNAWAL
jgi:hypothetical protein